MYKEYPFMRKKAEKVGFFCIKGTRRIVGGGVGDRAVVNLQQILWSHVLPPCTRLGFYIKRPHRHHSEFMNTWCLRKGFSRAATTTTRHWMETLTAFGNILTFISCAVTKLTTILLLDIYSFLQSGCHSGRTFALQLEVLFRVYYGVDSFLGFYLGRFRWKNC